MDRTVTPQKKKKKNSQPAITGQNNIAQNFSFDINNLNKLYDLEDFQLNKPFILP